MGDYTIKNVREDVDDAATQYGLSPSLEARFARDALDSNGEAPGRPWAAQGRPTPQRGRA